MSVPALVNRDVYPVSIKRIAIHGWKRRDRFRRGISRCLRRHFLHASIKYRWKNEQNHHFLEKKRKK